MSREVLRFKSVLVTPLTWELTWLYLEKYCLPHFYIDLFYFWGYLWAFIQLLDVNKVVNIIIILGEPHHPN
jgi:hypothetical protein